MNRRDFLATLTRGAAVLAGAAVLTPSCSRQPARSNLQIVRDDLEARIGNNYHIHVFSQLTNEIHVTKPELAYVHNGALLLYDGRIEFRGIDGSVNAVQGYSQRYNAPKMADTRCQNGKVELYLINQDARNNGSPQLLRLDILRGYQFGKPVVLWDTGNGSQQVSILGIVQDRYLVMQRYSKPENAIFDLDIPLKLPVWTRFDNKETTLSDRIIGAALNFDIPAADIPYDTGFHQLVGPTNDRVGLLCRNVGSLKGQYLVRLTPKSPATQPGGK